MWDLSGKEVHTFREDNLRVNDLAISPDGQRLVVLLENRILVYDFTSREKICEWHLEDVKLTSVTISQDSRHMLISMNKDKIKLMEIDTGEVIQRFEGQVQKQFIIRSSFGGADENFVVSGSEGRWSFQVIIGYILIVLKILGSISGGAMVFLSRPWMLTLAASTQCRGTQLTRAYLRLLATTPKSGFGNRFRLL